MKALQPTRAGPSNPSRERQARDLLIPPLTDHGSVPSLRWSFADSRNRIEEGGWARETTIRELPIATDMAGVNMRLAASAYWEMHWHQEAEWACMLASRARITAIDADGRTFADDTALSPVIGYQNAAHIAEDAAGKGTTLREAALASGKVSEAQYDQVVVPRAMVGEGVAGT